MGYIGRCPKPFPDHSCLPEYHIPYQQTPNEGRDVDDWQPRVLKKQHASGTLALTRKKTNSLSNQSLWSIKHQVMEFKRKKRMEERARESREAKEKRYELPLG